MEKDVFSPKQEEAFQAYRSFILQFNQVSGCWFNIIIESCKDIFPNSHITLYMVTLNPKPCVQFRGK